MHTAYGVRSRDTRGGGQFDIIPWEYVGGRAGGLVVCGLF